MRFDPRFLMTFGLTLLFLGIALPFLMVIKVLAPSFFLIFISSGSSTLGLAFGMVGLAHWSREPKQK